MEKRDTTVAQAIQTSAPASITGTRRPVEREAAYDAALEVAQATGSLAAGSIGIEAAAQAESVALGETVVPAGVDVREPELTREERREVGRSVFRLAWPAIGENALQTLLGLVDTAVVARLGTAALAGVGAAQQLVWVLTTALIAVSMGTTVLIAHFIGSNERRKANEVLKQSLIVAAVASIILTPVAFISGPLMAMLGLDGEAAQEGATYLSITLFFSISMVMMLVAGAALRGSGDTRTPMMVTGFINVINVILAIELVFGGVRASSVLGEWLTGLVNSFGISGQVNVPGLTFIPPMGVAGSALATALSRTLGAAILLGIFFLPRARLRLTGAGSWMPNIPVIWRMLKIGIPSALEQLFMSLGVLVFSFMVIGMGEVVFATSRLAVNAVFLSQLPGTGFAIAATTLVGQSLGAKSPRRALLGAQLSMRSAVIWMSAMGAIFIFFGDQILRVFTDDPQLLSMGWDALKVVALNQPALAIAFVLGGALRGAGDVRYPMWVTSLAVWFVRLPVAAFLGLPQFCLPFTGVCTPGLGLGLVGVYFGLVVEGAIRAALMFFRFRGGKWQRIKV
jgi:putative MATE family efflux protein